MYDIQKSTRILLSTLPEEEKEKLANKIKRNLSIYDLRSLGILRKLGKDR